MEKAEAIDVGGTVKLVPASPIAPIAASVELLPDTSVLPLEERLKLVHRRRYLLALRTWAALIGTFAVAGILVAVAVVAFIGR